ncbi:MAG: hypothetical protein UH685_07700, partial [Bacteroidaceae bacterium]|nr:hypothetical protein [Bacteroidaceae bacterium]
MTKRTLLSIFFCSTFLALWAQTISIATNNTQMVLQVNSQQRLCQTYLGERLSEQTDLGQLYMP